MAEYKFGERRAIMFHYMGNESGAYNRTYAMYDVRQWLHDKFGPSYVSDDGLTWTCTIWEEINNVLVFYDESAALEFKLRWG